MTKPKVFVTRRLVQEALDRLDREVDLIVWPGEDPPPRQNLIESLQHVEGLLCLLTDSIDAEVLSGAKSLRAVSNLATGYDNIDVEAAKLERLRHGRDQPKPDADYRSERERLIVLPQCRT